jgi:hypothetical protein
MDLQSFVQKRPYLYHLTFRENLPHILQGKTIYSTNELLLLSKVANPENISRVKRNGHTALMVDGQNRLIRDQKPISEKALAKCLTGGWSCADYYEFLNERVFTWPTLERLERHYGTYKEEKPVIVRLCTAVIIERNPHVKFCRLNSGATRANSYLGGIPPFRGADTFQCADDYDFPVGSVAEVTFEKLCRLDGEIFITDSPNGNYERVDY